MLLLQLLVLLLELELWLVLLVLNELNELTLLDSVDDVLLLDSDDNDEADFDVLLLELQLTSTLELLLVDSELSELRLISTLELLVLALDVLELVEELETDDVLDEDSDDVEDEDNELLLSSSTVFSHTSALRPAPSSPGTMIVMLGVNQDVPTWSSSLISYLRFDCSGIVNCVASAANVCDEITSRTVADKSTIVTRRAAVELVGVPSCNVTNLRDISPRHLPCYSARVVVQYGIDSSRQRFAVFDNLTSVSPRANEGKPFCPVRVRAAAV